MRMNSDLGKLKRRNYMVKAQLKSLESKSRAINEKINNESNVDEWAESYIARADAQIDDVSDYMNFRNLQNLSGFTDNFDPGYLAKYYWYGRNYRAYWRSCWIIDLQSLYASRRAFWSSYATCSKYALIAAGVTVASKGIIYGGQQTGQY